MLQIVLIAVLGAICVSGMSVSVIEIHESASEHRNQSYFQPKYIISETDNEVTDQLNICTTTMCDQESAKMLSFMNENANPCDDFYEFACGKFLQETVLPEDKDIEMSVTQVQDKIDEQLRVILTESLHQNESKAFEVAKVFMTSCLDEVTLNKNGTMEMTENDLFDLEKADIFERGFSGIAPLVDILERYGGWPVINGDNWRSDDWNWLDIKRQIHNDGLIDDLILECRIGTDFMNSSKRIIQVKCSNTIN